jgi:poly(A) polymerase
MTEPTADASFAVRAIDRACANYLGKEVWESLKTLAGVFVVGGGVRDPLLGRPVADLDIVALPENAPAVESALAPFRRQSIRINDRFSTVRYLLNNGAFLDFSVAPDTGILADLLRRDFTINAMAIETQTMSLWDPANGFKDLLAKRLSAVHPENFRDDPLRILRGYRIARECGLAWTPETRSAIVSARDLLSTVAPERIYEELRRLLRLQGSAADLRQMANDQVLFALFPEMTPMTTTPASPVFELNVLEHTLASLDALDAILQDPSEQFGRFGTPLALFLARDDWHFILRVSLLLHDIAKPATATFVKGSLHYYGHDARGALMAEQILRRFRFSNRDRALITALIRAHLRIGFLSEKDHLNPRQIYRYFHEFGDLGIPLIVHARADLLGYAPNISDQPYGRHQPAITETLLSAYFERNQILIRPPRFLAGDDLIALGIPPGPIYTTILEAAQEATALGKISSHEQARDWARKFYEHLTHKGALR